MELQSEYMGDLIKSHTYNFLHTKLNFSMRKVTEGLRSVCWSTNTFAIRALHVQDLSCERSESGGTSRNVFVS